MNAHAASQPDTTNARSSAYPGGPNPETRRPAAVQHGADAPVSILALVGLAFLLFLSGLQIDVERLSFALLSA
jgi:hypothetical protein